MDAFGDASNPRNMTKDKILLGGEFGMRRVYSLVVVRVLDDLDTEHPDYASLLRTINDWCKGVARKIRNYFKSGSSASTVRLYLINNLHFLNN